MKNIKKFLIVTFAVLTVLTFTGCEKKYEKSKLKPEEALTKAQESAKEVENYKLAMNMLVEATASEGNQSIDMDMKVNYEGTYDEKNKTGHMSMGVEILGFKEKAEMYILTDEASKTTTVYTEVNNAWVKETSPAVENSNKVLSLEDLISEGFDVKEIDPDKNNYNYEITINNDTLKKIMSATDTNESTSEILKNITGNIKLLYSLDRETYQVSRIYMDLTEALNNLNLEGVEYKKVSFEILIYDYDKAGSVIIPQEVIKNAI